MRKDYVCEVEFEEEVAEDEQTLDLLKVELVVTRDTDKGQKKVRVENRYGNLTLIPKHK